MNVVSGENPPVAINSRSHKLRMVILIDDNLDARARSSSRSCPSTTRLTSFPPYGVMSLAFDIEYSMVYWQWHSMSNVLMHTAIFLTQGRIILQNSVGEFWIV